MDELAAASGDLMAARDALDEIDGLGDSGRSFWDESEG
jgi:hypothetical protein